jgi:hypothetical protein
MLQHGIPQNHRYQKTQTRVMEIVFLMTSRRAHERVLKVKLVNVAHERLFRICAATQLETP